MVTPKIKPQGKSEYRQMMIALGQLKDPLTGRKEPSFRDFCRWIYLPNKDKNQPGQPSLVRMDPKNWLAEQRDFDLKRTGKDIVLKGRQIGFTTFEAMRDLFFALTRPNSKVRIIAHDLSTPKTILRLIRDAYQNLHIQFPELFAALDDKQSGQAFNASQIIFVRPGGKSEIEVQTAGKTEGQATKGRGGSVDRAHFSEVAFWAMPEETMSSQFPSLHGEVVFESTPNKLGDWFHGECKLAEMGHSEFKFHFWPWWVHEKNIAPVDKTLELEDGIEIPLTEDEKDIFLKCPTLTPEQLAFWRNKKAKLKSLSLTKAEYPTDPHSCFISSGGMFMRPEDREHLDSVTQKTENIGPHGCYVYQEPEPGEQYCIGVDCAGGDGGDRSAVVILHVKTSQVVCTFADNHYGDKQMVAVVRDLSTMYNHAPVWIERETYGHSLRRQLETQGTYLFDSSVYKGEPGEWITGNSHSRQLLFGAVSEALREKVFQRPFCPVIASELSMITGGQKPMAPNKNKKLGTKTGEIKPGDTDDLVIALGIALLMKQEILTYGTTEVYAEVSRGQATDSIFGFGSPDIKRGVLW